jgi:hypothetical protein
VGLSERTMVPTNEKEPSRLQNTVQNVLMKVIEEGTANVWAYYSAKL